MPTEIRTWQIVSGKPLLLETTLSTEGRKEQADLEAWIAADVSILAPDLAIIGRQVQTRSGPLDLLAIHRDGDIVIVELKRDQLPREALAQAIDYASDVADWDLDKLSEISQEHSGKPLKEVFEQQFPDADIDAITVNEAQRIVLLGFSIDPALERMIGWLSTSYGVPVNAVLLSYSRTSGGDELLTRTSVISEQVAEDRGSRKRFPRGVFDEPGNHSEPQLKAMLTRYLRQDMYSSRRIAKVILPTLLERGQATREELRAEFVRRGEADNLRDAGYFLSLVSQQFSMKANDFLRQVIGYSHPNNAWEKDNYLIRTEYRRLVEEVLAALRSAEPAPPPRAV